ncbi:hypothetical protein [Bdellovibrio reynosensis]|uniref:Uncharacterized protein n=1 Tax=Bdellovibrio reynosensis TaxID=2835041 RepID=A0ABY4CCD7_9BACT|nr:hypothetical protein [Bdellovibrio reynosensis]UOE99859.1 hypothetical protein MNR06_09135 [Bdellovibrio reynosensis]
MERFKVSGDDLRNFYQGNIELGKVFSDIESDLRSTNQVVCRYIVNGLEIAEAEEAKFATVTLEQIETLEYLTENSRDLTSIVLKGWIEALPELIQNTENLAQRMRTQGFTGLLKSIHELVSNCEYLIDSTVMIKSTMGDQFLVTSPVDWFKAEEESKRTVTEALQALENKDFVLLADVLEYDLNNVLQMWLDHLRMLEKSLNGEYTGPNSIDTNQTRSNSMGGKRIAN